MKSQLQPHNGESMYRRESVEGDRILFQLYDSDVSLPLKSLLTPSPSPSVLLDFRSLDEFGAFFVVIYGRLPARVSDLGLASGLYDVCNVGEWRIRGK